MKVSSITPDTSMQQAIVISTTAKLNESTSGAAGSTGGTTLTFEQTINAPEPLSTNDIYRSTKSQIALAKKELSIL